MHTENAIEMRAGLDAIVALAADVERWPALLPHYRSVTVVEQDGERKVVEMAAKRDWFPVRWRAIQEIRRDGATPVISYRHVRGVTRGMEVAWTFEPLGERVLVRIRHDFQPPWPLVGGPIADRVIGPVFVAYIAGRTLTAIKRIAEEAVSGELAHGW